MSEHASSKAGSVSWSAQGNVANVLIANHGHLNAITVAMWGQLRQCLHEISARDDLRVVVVRGAPGAFAAGADIAEFKRVRMTRDQVRQFHDEMIAPALASVVNCPIPVLAAIDGPCVGGGLEIASVCDIRIATDRSRFGIPILRLGFPLAPAEAAGLVRLVGKSVALEILLEGRIMEADEAYDKGLINRIVPLSIWEDEVQATWRRIACGAPHAAKRNKWLIHMLSAIKDREILSPMQRDACWDFVETQDYARGIDAFLAKTAPNFQNN
jgi:enoyl-CoA hydratase/carnithine racemase